MTTLLVSQRLGINLKPLAIMESLPQELIELVLLWNVRMCKCDKNEVLPLRLVCKAFDVALKPYIFKTIPLDFSKFLKVAETPGLRDLTAVGALCQAVYLNMMVIRDEGMLVLLPGRHSP